MKNSGIFITGTDTGVGKTMVTAALLADLRSQGIDAVPMKPIQTGRTSDLSVHLKAGHLKPTATELKWMNPYRFTWAVSPHLAAKSEKVKISLTKILSAYRQLEKAHDFVLVEGAGGVLVPIIGNRTMLDLMKRLKLPVLVVARPSVGTLNHTLLTLNELRRAKVEVLGVVLVQSEKSRWGTVEKNNLETIARLGKTKVFRFPFLRL